MLIKNTVLWPFVRGCGTVFLCGEDGRDWKGEEVWMDGRQRPETAGDSAVVFKTSATLRKAKCQLRLIIRRNSLTETLYTTVTYHHSQQTGRTAKGEAVSCHLQNDAKCAFSFKKIQCLRRLMREGFPERISRSWHLAF